MKASSRVGNKFGFCSYLTFHFVLIILSSMIDHTENTNENYFPTNPHQACDQVLIVKASAIRFTCVVATRNWCWFVFCKALIDLNLYEFNLSMKNVPKGLKMNRKHSEIFRVSCTFITLNFVFTYLLNVKSLLCLFTNIWFRLQKYKVTQNVKS